MFYGWWDPRFIALLAGSIVANYAIGQRILAFARVGRDGAARRWLAIGVALDLALLGWFKYAGFLARAGAALAGLHAPALEVALPLAISFFTFQQIMFLADSARADRPDAGFGAYAAFVAFFPHLIAGPIVRPREIIPQLTSRTLARPSAEAIVLSSLFFFFFFFFFYLIFLFILFLFIFSFIFISFFLICFIFFLCALVFVFLHTDSLLSWTVEL